jgi:hypothetical protein
MSKTEYRMTKAGERRLPEKLSFEILHSPFGIGHFWKSCARWFRLFRVRPAEDVNRTAEAFLPGVEAPP